MTPETITQGAVKQPLHRKGYNMNNQAMETLFADYLENRAGNLNAEVDKAFSKITRMVGDDAGVSEALSDMQYATMHAAFYAGFRTAIALLLNAES